MESSENPFSEVRMTLYNGRLLEHLFHAFKCLEETNANGFFFGGGGDIRVIV